MVNTFTSGVQAFESPIEHAKCFIVNSLQLAHGNHAPYISWQKLADQSGRLGSGFSDGTLRRARDELQLMNEVTKIRQGALYLYVGFDHDHHGNLSKCRTVKQMTEN